MTHHFVREGTSVIGSTGVKSPEAGLWGFGATTLVCSASNIVSAMALSCGCDDVINSWDYQPVSGDPM
jgi:hypothetical protein